MILIYPLPRVVLRVKQGDDDDGAEEGEDDIKS